MTRKHAKFLPLAVAATVAAALQIYPAGVFSGLELATSTAYAAAEHSEFPPAGDWRTISDDALGFKIDYPGNIFHRVERDDAVMNFMRALVEVVTLRECGASAQSQHSDGQIKRFHESPRSFNRV